MKSPWFSHFSGALRKWFSEFRIKGFRDQNNHAQRGPDNIWSWEQMLVSSARTVLFFQACLLLKLLAHRCFRLRVPASYSWKGRAWSCYCEAESSVETLGSWRNQESKMPVDGNFRTLREVMRTAIGRAKRAGNPGTFGTHKSSCPARSARNEAAKFIVCTYCFRFAVFLFSFIAVCFPFRMEILTICNRMLEVLDIFLT